MICFASNDTLSTRFGGMPESTLRRHISALVQAGVILRHDSPNRKRYAKRVRGSVAIAFGFDLGPLACMADEIDALARTYTARVEERAALHSAVLVSRQRLNDRLEALGVDPEAVHEHSHLLARTRLFLRRKDNNEDLQTLLSEYETALETLETSASNTQNERHQHSKKI